MNASQWCFTLVEEVDGLHAGVLLIADLQLVELTEQIYQFLHHLHPILTETTHTHTHTIHQYTTDFTDDLTGPSGLYFVIILMIMAYSL